ncbi:MarR family winged helix-turn-helix transcriptional regulator [Pseudalkalibacillus decolorationis]|uniref:MarR family winged helix-turn-helix transcriptional regulator n=1 Tax=Pseudalkalibacillus decolorationis TaxID=163879 RepID=UPI0021478FB7|nr:MarR family transcriptional regulator [Pseudalkalibacillus decolorationis]
MTEFSSDELNTFWSDIYFHLRYSYDGKITHQAIRILQLIDREKEITVKDVANHLSISHNTASAHIKRLIAKKLVTKIRDLEDERRVLIELTFEGAQVLKVNTTLDKQKLEVVLESLNEDETATVKSAFKLLSERSKRCLP